MVLYIKKSSLDAIIKHAKKAYPYEACGVLVGFSKAKDKFVMKVFKTRNVFNSSCRYRIDPEDQFRIFEETRSNKLDVVGFYHSHPSMDAYWSSIDEEGSAIWRGLSFIIFSVKFNRMRCYSREEKVEEEKVVIDKSNLANPTDERL